MQCVNKNYEEDFYILCCMCCTNLISTTLTCCTGAFVVMAILSVNYLKSTVQDWQMISKLVCFPLASPTELVNFAGVLDEEV